jgi:Flp pilus assembly protein TadD
MKRFSLALLALPVLMGACAGPVGQKVDPLAKNVIDDAGLANLMLNAGDPEEAVGYFERALAEEPERAEFRRGLAISLARAKRQPEAARVYQELITLGQATPADQLDYAFVAMQLDQWDEVRQVETTLPPGLNTARRHLLTGLLSDHDQSWEASDAAYTQARQLSPNPARVLNNWGVSHQARGDLKGAERLFNEAVSYDSRLFSAKNNLAMTRALQGNYDLPLVPMTEPEKATILNNLGIIATRRNEIRMARGLFAAAVSAHPQYYAGAADRLAALEAKQVN